MSKYLLFLLFVILISPISMAFMITNNTDQDIKISDIYEGGLKRNRMYFEIPDTNNAIIAPGGSMEIEDRVQSAYSYDYQPARFDTGFRIELEYSGSVINFHVGKILNQNPNIKEELLAGERNISIEPSASRPGVIKIRFTKINGPAEE